MSERNAEQGAQTGPQNFWMVLPQELPEGLLEELQAVWTRRKLQPYFADDGILRIRPAAATPVQSPEEGQPDTAVLETLRKRIDASGLTTEQFIKAFNELTPEQIRAHREQKAPTCAPVQPSSCGHIWDTSLHRACPRCAIASVEAVLKQMVQKFQAIYSESCIIGYDSGNVKVAQLAQEGMDLWRIPRENLSGDATCAPVQEGQTVVADQISRRGESQKLVGPDSFPATTEAVQECACYCCQQSCSDGCACEYLLSRDQFVRQFGKDQAPHWDEYHELAATPCSCAGLREELNQALDSLGRSDIHERQLEDENRGLREENERLKNRILELIMVDRERDSLRSQLAAANERAEKLAGALKEIEDGASVRKVEKPTIAELETILSDPNPKPVHFMPNGEVFTGRHPREIAESALRKYRDWKEQSK